MGIFGFFGKKKKLKTDDADGVPAVTVPTRLSSSAPGDSAQDQRNARANATAKKIDAIESEMSSEFVPSRGLSPAASRARSGAPHAGVPRARPASSNAASLPPLPIGMLESTTHNPHIPSPSTVPVVDSAQIFESTLPGIGMSTEFLLGAEGRHIPLEMLSSQAAQVIEEAAILFADQQTDVVEQMLRSAIDENGEDNVREVWWLLFDLLQVTGKQQAFETLSLEYAAKFETSPPSWVTPAPAAPAAGGLRAPAPPSVPFAGKLDGNILKAIARAQKIAENSRVLRLEFGRITEVDPVGCGLLLRLLKKLQASDHELILAGAPELAARIRAIIEVGRRDETEAPWLLLLELTRTLNLEQQFEETAIDYCVTFEVSPPTFVPPKSTVTATRDDGAAGARVEQGHGFMLPAVIEGRTDQLFAAVVVFIETNNPAVLDCSCLNRIDFSSASQLLSSLAPLSAGGKTIRFEQVNHLVAALFTVIGIDDVARVTARKL